MLHLEYIFTGWTLICLLSYHATGSSRRIENFLDIDNVNTDRSCAFTCQSLDEFYREKRANCLVESPMLPLQKSSDTAQKVNYVDDPVNNYSAGGLPLLENNLLPPVIISSGPFPPNADLDSRTFDPAGDVLKEDRPQIGHDPLDLGQLFKESYCKAVELDGSSALNEAVNDDVDSCIHEKGEKPEDGDDDEMLGGIFAFSEDGKVIFHFPLRYYVVGLSRI